ncbi:DUF2179 domain-containing protein [Methanofollis fontis]|uniref:UPF0316 protein CUJ86_03325 n=1 Tax=Methanofollis fontis TaxID=2052832 RepID=A0A483CTN4_9EURY|nr:DUF2179 domain-containing protein [Methanofollis fontis]TAJ45754.1 hypothetical protein CUJ86_03325 [Methanofollis fontis]
MEPWVFSGILLPVLIFLSRIADVTLGTMRIIVVNRGMKIAAPILGFFEILIWLIAIGQIFSNLTNYVNYIAYAGGFAAGNYIGIMVEEKIAMGHAVVRIIVQQDANTLIGTLRGAGYGVTVMDGQGMVAPSKVLFTVVRRRNVPDVIRKVREISPKAFYSVEDIRQSAEGTFPKGRTMPGDIRLFQYFRKGK